LKKVLLYADVPDWAWGIKARQIQKYLSDEFEITIQYRSQKEKIERIYDIYFSFEINQVHLFDGIPSNKKISGVTAHTYVNFRDYPGLLKKCDNVHANSRMLVEELTKLHPCVWYVPNGVDEELFMYQERDINQEFTVGYAGKNNKYKGLEDVIRPACEKAKVKLVTQACKHNERNRLPHTHMPDFFANIDLVMIASDTDGTPNQMLEGASTGRTFIGNRRGNIPEFVNDSINGFMISDKKNTAEYIDKLIFLKENREACKQMGIAARKTIEEGWTWKTQAENYRKMFRSIK